MLNTRRQFISSLIHGSTLVCASSLAYSSLPTNQISSSAFETDGERKQTQLKTAWKQDYKKMIGTLATLSASLLVIYRDELLLAVFLLFLFFLTAFIGLPLAELVVKYHIA